MNMEKKLGYHRDNIMYEGVTMERPQFAYEFPPDGPSDSMLRSAEGDFNKRWDDFHAALASAPQLPAIGFEGEGVRKYDYEYQQYADVRGRLPEFIKCTKHVYDSMGMMPSPDKFRRIVAVPAITVQEDKPEPPPVVNEKGSGESAEEVANYAVQMRYKSPNSAGGISDFELYHEILDKIKRLTAPRRYSLTAKEMVELFNAGGDYEYGRGAYIQNKHPDCETYLHSKYGITPEEIK